MVVCVLAACMAINIWLQHLEAHPLLSGLGAVLMLAKKRAVVCVALAFEKKDIDAGILSAGAQKEAVAKAREITGK